MPQAIRQSNNANTNNIVPPATATRISSTVPSSATKNSSNLSSTSNSSKSIFKPKIIYENKSDRRVDFLHINAYKITVFTIDFKILNSI